MGGKEAFDEPAVEAWWTPLETRYSRLDSERLAPRAADNFIGASNTFRAVQAVLGGCRSRLLIAHAHIDRDVGGKRGFQEDSPSRPGEISYDRKQKYAVQL